MSPTPDETKEPLHVTGLLVFYRKDAIEFVWQPDAMVDPLVGLLKIREYIDHITEGLTYVGRCPE